MLTSSDAKWKCLWYLLVWSIQLMLVSQFLYIKEHIAFYIFAAISVLILPVLTAVYSNTSGRHGAGFLRVGLVFCDPVIACLSVTPVLLLNKGPEIMEEHNCFLGNTEWNLTYYCLMNKTNFGMAEKFRVQGPSIAGKEDMIIKMKTDFLVIEMSVIVPIIVALSMGKRTRKMTVTTYLIGFAYWFITSIESIGLLEIVLLNNRYGNIVFTVETIICIALIVTNSYAIVTLCSYINPMNLIDNKRTKHKFDFLYRLVLAVSGMFFTEIPLFISRCHILSDDAEKILPGTFYVWLLKDIFWLVLIPVLVYVQRFGQKYLRVPCKPRFSNKHLHFQPEKRDAYINRYKHRIYTIPSEESATETVSLLKKSYSEPSIQKCDEVLSLRSIGSKSTSALDEIGKNSMKVQKPVSKTLSPFAVKEYKKQLILQKPKLNRKKRVTFKLDLGSSWR